MTILASLLAAATLAAAKPVSPLMGHGPAATPLSSAAANKTSYALSSNVLSLSRVMTGAKHSALYKLTSKSNFTTPLLSLFEGEEFATDITISGTAYPVIVDTGSSDTWLVQTGFNCVDVETSAPESEESCHFGKTYQPDDSFAKVDDENFNISYGDGEFLTGYMGTEDIKIAGLVAKNQTMGVVDYAGWSGDNTTSGLLGLAYSGLTSAYQGENATLDGKKGHRQIQYSPVFTTLVSQDKTDSLFSLAISRDLSGDAGYLALGGLPPVNTTGEWVTTPILKTEESGYNTGWDFYTITIDGITLGENDTIIKNSGGKDVYYIVDSGTTLNYLPTDAASAINTAFSPAATYSDEVGGYIVPCNATAPIVGTSISGAVLPIDPLDLLLPLDEKVDGVEICLSGVVDGGPLAADELYILGDVFLKSLVAVFDQGKETMAFIQRESYESNDPYRV